MNEEQDSFEVDLQELDNEIETLDSDLFALDSDMDGDFSELSDELEEAGLGEFAFGDGFMEQASADGSVGMESLVELGEEGQADMAFLGGFLRKKARRLLQLILRLIKKYRRCRKCLPLFRKAVAAYKRRKYVTAIRYCYRAYRCIRNCIKKRK